jgi:hypothetical protein
MRAPRVSAARTRRAFGGPRFRGSRVVLQEARYPREKLDPVLHVIDRMALVGRNLVLDRDTSPSQRPHHLVGLLAWHARVVLAGVHVEGGSDPLHVAQGTELLEQRPVPIQIAELVDEADADRLVGRPQERREVRDPHVVDTGAPRGRLPRERHQDRVAAVAAPHDDDAVGVRPRLRAHPRVHRRDVLQPVRALLPVIGHLVRAAVARGAAHIRLQVRVAERHHSVGAARGTKGPRPSCAILGENAARLHGTSVAAFLSHQVI